MKIVYHPITFMPISCDACPFENMCRVNKNNSEYYDLDDYENDIWSNCPLVEQTEVSKDLSLIKEMLEKEEYHMALKFIEMLEGKNVSSKQKVQE